MKLTSMATILAISMDTLKMAILLARSIDIGMEEMTKILISLYMSNQQIWNFEFS